jgi:hypothetical protein
LQLPLANWNVRWLASYQNEAAKLVPLLSLVSTTGQRGIATKVFFA